MNAPLQGPNCVRSAGQPGGGTKTDDGARQILRVARTAQTIAPALIQTEQSADPRMVAEPILRLAGIAFQRCDHVSTLPLIAPPRRADGAWLASLSSVRTT